MNKLNILKLLGLKTKHVENWHWIVNETFIGIIKTIPNPKAFNKNVFPRLDLNGAILITRKRKWNLFFELEIKEGEKQNIFQKEWTIAHSTIRVVRAMAMKVEEIFVRTWKLANYYIWKYWCHTYNHWCNIFAIYNVSAQNLSKVKQDI